MKVESDRSFILGIAKELTKQSSTNTEGERINLDFYQPIEGKGEYHWIAKISIADKTAYYCAARTIKDLIYQILDKEQKYFPNCLELEKSNIEISRERLVHTYVDDDFVEKTCERFEAEGRSKMIGEAKIKPSISVPADAELMPIVEPGEEKTKGFMITKRNLLAKHEILAAAAPRIEKEIQEAYIGKKGDGIVWISTLDRDKFILGPSTGELICQ